MTLHQHSGRNGPFMTDRIRLFLPHPRFRGQKEIGSVAITPNGDLVAMYELEEGEGKLYGVCHLSYYCSHNILISNHS